MRIFAKKGQMTQSRVEKLCLRLKRSGMPIAVSVASIICLAIGAKNAYCVTGCADRGESKPVSIPVSYDNGVQEKKFYSQSYALVIGAVNYVYFDRLPAVSDEVNNVADALARQNFAVHMICDPAMSSSAGFSEVAKFLASHGDESSRVVIFFSGHGWVDESSSVKTGYFAGVDSPQDDVDLPGARSHGFSSRDVILAVQQSHAKHVLVVVDACHSSALFITVKGGGPRRFVINQAPSPEEYDNLSEATREFITVADDERAPSPSAFSAAFVLGIEGNADLDGDGLVRFSELTEYVKKMVENSSTLRTRPTSGLIPQKTGEIVDEGGGEIVFRYRPEDKAKSYDRMRGVGKTYLVQAESTAAPSTPTNWPDPKYYVAYYTKSIDHGRVISAMETASIPLHMTAPVLPDNTVSNGIACTDSTPLDALKTTAHALIDGGVPIYVVSRATKRIEKRRFQIQVLHYQRAISSHYKPLTAEEINELRSCPGTVGFFNSGGGAKDHGGD